MMSTRTTQDFTITKTSLGVVNDTQAPDPAALSSTPPFQPLQYLNRNRFYRPDIGRFASVDPLSRLSGLFQNKLLLSSYGYAGNNSIVAIDPFGLVKWNCNFTFAAVGRAVIQVGAFSGTCTSECKCDKVVDATFIAPNIGLGFGFPIAVGSLTLTLDDGLACPAKGALGNWFALGNAGLTLGQFDFSKTQLSIGWDAFGNNGASTGYGAGVSITWGWAYIKYAEYDECCK